MLSREHDQPLSAGDRASLRLHLMLCSACRNFKNNLLIIRAAMKQYLDKGADRNHPDK